ncbi:MAG: hypothetical protein A2Y38_02595 [Spirochaetes bacterium GWB1_59_5]|nr:MAG: hypothetical protein A2Y38_02595 [Spirochaetes bacterium GWB1_59_5]
MIRFTALFIFWLLTALSATGQETPTAAPLTPTPIPAPPLFTPTNTPEPGEYPEGRTVTRVVPPGGGHEVWRFSAGSVNYQDPADRRWKVIDVRPEQVGPDEWQVVKANHVVRLKGRDLTLRTRAGKGLRFTFPSDPVVDREARKISAGPVSFRLHESGIEFILRVGEGFNPPEGRWQRTLPLALVGGATEQREFDAGIQPVRIAADDTNSSTETTRLFAGTWRMHPPTIIDASGQQWPGTGLNGETLPARARIVRSATGIVLQVNDTGILRPYDLDPTFDATSQFARIVDQPGGAQTWADINDDTTGTSVTTSGSPLLNGQSYGGSGGNNRAISRGATVFDTSSIAAIDTVTAATFMFACVIVQSPAIHVFVGSGWSNPIITADYDGFTGSSRGNVTPGGTDVADSEKIVISTPDTFIIKGGSTLVMTREVNDVNVTDPGNGVNRYASARTQGDATAAKRPHLVVAYNTATPTPTNTPTPTPTDLYAVQDNDAQGDTHKATWSGGGAGARDSATGTLDQGGTKYESSFTGGEYYIFRTFFSFNTTMIPANSTITDASVWLTAQSLLTGGSDDDAQIMKGTQAATGALDTNSYNDLDLTTPYSAETTWLDTDIADNVKIPLTGTLANIVKAATYTKIVLVSRYDAQNIAPSDSANGGIVAGYDDPDGPAFRPKLQVHYQTPTPTATNTPTPLPATGNFLLIMD